MTRNGRTIFSTGSIDKYLEFHSSMSHDPQAERFFQQQAGLRKRACTRPRTSCVPTRCKAVLPIPTSKSRR